MPLLTNSVLITLGQVTPPGPHPHPHSLPPPPPPPTRPAPLYSPYSSQRDPLKRQSPFCNMNSKGTSCTIPAQSPPVGLHRIRRKSKIPWPGVPAPSDPMTPWSSPPRLSPCSLCTSHTALLPILQTGQDIPYSRPFHCPPGMGHIRGCLINVCVWQGVNGGQRDGGLNPDGGVRRGLGPVGRHQGIQLG